MVKRFRHVILGGGMVAGYAARELVQNGLAPGELCILSADSAAPCERPPLSKKFLAGIKDEDSVYINKPSFYAEHGIDLRLNTTVTQVDPGGMRLRSESGDEIGFEKLLIATGTRVRNLDVPGADLGNIFYLRWLQDSKAIRQGYQSARRAVIVGGGYIGMEVAAVLRQKGLDVTMVFPGEHLLSRVFTPEMADYFEGYYRRQGVRLLKGKKVIRFDGATLVSSVVLDTGERLPADIVVAGVGVEPATEVLQAAGLEVDEGVVVNEYLETAVANIYAAGDVASFRDLVFDKQRRLEHWDNAVSQGQYAAGLLLGRREPYKHLSYFFSDEFDLSWELWGDAKEAEEVVYRGDVSSGKFSAWWLAKGHVMCAFVMNRPDEERELAPQWISSKTRVSPSALHEESRDLAAVAR